MSGNAEPRNRSLGKTDCTCFRWPIVDTLKCGVRHRRAERGKCNLVLQRHTKPRSSEYTEH